MVPSYVDIPVFGHEFEYIFSTQLRYNYRLDPQPRHRIALGKAFGCAWVVFNDRLAARQAAHEAALPYIRDAELSARLTAAKATPGRAWLTEVSSVVLQQALADLNAANRNYFASLKGKRKGPKIGPPKFRSRKDHRQAVRFVMHVHPFSQLGPRHCGRGCGHHHRRVSPDAPAVLAEEQVGVTVARAAQRIGHGGHRRQSRSAYQRRTASTASASGIPGSLAARALLARPVNPCAARSSHPSNRSSSGARQPFAAMTSSSPMNKAMPRRCQRLRPEAIC
jgi:hypothetical protein